MLKYTAPLIEYRFIVDEVLQLQEVLPQLPECRHIDTSLVHTMLRAGAELATDLLLPINAPGDQAGCTLSNGQVTTPEGFAQAYKRFYEDGWPALTVPTASGGQGFPGAAGALFDEILASTNLSFSIFANVREGVLRCINTFGSKEVKNLFSSRLTSGEWLGTMCLTEPQAGSDLGLIRSTAVPQLDGTYLLSGSKIFISNGDHSLTSNIVHLVLARTPDAPEGSKGLTLFAVPKLGADDNGAFTRRNGVTVTGLEKKHGIRANATCSLAFDNARAFRVGDLYRGLSCMFVLMNSARLAVGIQTVGLAEVAYQNALRYAQERLQGRALNAPARADLPADPLLSHIGVKASLAEQRLFIEAARLLTAWVGTLIDQARCHTDPVVRQTSSELVELLTPVVKGYLSNHAIEHIRSAMQLFGGHGYMAETGMEQLLRDAGICPIYEGTNYIQALDLLGRKTLADQGARLKTLGREMLGLADRLAERSALADLAGPLRQYVIPMETLADGIMVDAVFNRDVVGLLAPDFLELVGTAVFAYLWAWMAEAADKGSDGRPYYRDKITMASLYMQQSAPRFRNLIAAIQSNAMTLEHLGRLQSLHGEGERQ